MKLTVIIPIYNEVSTCLELLSKVKTVQLPMQIIVVDDGSTDGSGTLIENTDNIEILIHQNNKGKGAAIKTALPYAAGDYIIFQDGDLEYSPDDFGSLLEAMNENTDAVFGSRFLLPNRQLTYHTIGNKLITGFFNFITGASLSDVASCYKLLSTQLLKDLDIQSNGFGLEAEISAKLVKGNYRITEIPINYTRRSKQEGKKLRLKDGIIAAWTIIYNQYFR